MKEDESLGESLLTVYFDELGNVNNTHSFTDNAESQKDAMRAIFLGLVNAVHLRMDTIEY